MVAALVVAYASILVCCAVRCTCLLLPLDQVLKRPALLPPCPFPVSWVLGPRAAHLEVEVCLMVGAMVLVVTFLILGFALAVDVWLRLRAVPPPWLCDP